MKLVPLIQVSAQMRKGHPLPWDVRDEHGKLLLARGRVLDSDAVIEGLKSRGTFVDADEAARAAQLHAVAAKEPFFDRWAALELRLSGLLRNPEQPGFLDRINDACQTLIELTDRHADQLIFAIIRHDQHRFMAYGVVHSLHAAAVCALLTRKADWPAAKRASLIGAALTMNVSTVELQGVLAARGGRLTSAQAAIIQGHPMASAAMLRKLGLDDDLWLQAVEQHHEQEGGKGYPAAVASPCELAQILRLVDVFTAKHSARSGRPSVPAKQAAQELYLQNPGHPVASLLIKEFGIYPPGTLVKLASGEAAVVVRRGPQANTPVAAVILNRNGDALSTPIRRDTSTPEYAVTQSISEKVVLVQVFPDKVYERAELE